jgi:hypothetical protein
VSPRAGERDGGTGDWAARPDEPHELAVWLRERADAEEVLADVLVQEDGTPATLDFRAYLRARVGAWRTAADVVEQADEQCRPSALATALTRLMHRSREASPFATPVYQTAVSTLGEIYDRLRDRAARERDLTDSGPDTA